MNVPVAVLMILVPLAIFGAATLGWLAVQVYKWNKEGM